MQNGNRIITCRRGYRTSRIHFVGTVSCILCCAFNDIYNINADSAASAIASQLSAEKLIFLTDQQGVLNDSKELISSLNFSEIKNLIDLNIISGGMLPKIQACISAIENNVKMAHIVDGRVQHSVLLEIFTKEGIGTLVKND